MLLQSLWPWAVQALTPSSSTPHLDTEILLAFHLGLTRAQLYATASYFLMTPTQQARIETAVERRKSGEPIAYLLGQQEFWSLSFIVNASVLIPRPETELLVQLVLENYTQAAIKIADLGTGSGAIAIALARERSAWQLIATDYCRNALQLAEENRCRHNAQHIELRQGDWCHAFHEGERFEVIISNPPYLAPHDPHFCSELGLRFEPEIALIAGENGLNHFQTIIRQARSYLQEGGALFLEHGYQQAALLGQLFWKYGYHSVRHYDDLLGHQRVTSGKWH